MTMFIRFLVCATLLQISSTCPFWGQETGDSFMIPPKPEELKHPSHPAPGWLRDAVIVEVPIRAFNHPNVRHPNSWINEFGSASYQSIIEKLPFLKEMGVNVICLYSIYHHTPGTNLYAIRHHQPDPTLGTLDDVKTLIREAHDIGMYVISNTNYYGCDVTSPMITEHPDWFLGPENDLYGQRVFDINNPELVQYLIDTRAWWCTEVGLDGWRIDIAHKTYRKRIWDQVLSKAAVQNKPILLATEGVHLEGHIRGAGWGTFPVSLDPMNPRANWENPGAPYGAVQGFDNFTSNDPYRLKDISSHNSTVPCPFNYDPAVCPREGAYQIQGSRFLFGHNLMFTPLVPTLMPGELFNATHLVVPGVMGHRLRGKLLHSYLEWEFSDAQHQVIEDFKKIARIRLENRDLFHNNGYETNLISPEFTVSPELNVKPYIRFIPGQKAAVVIGNNNIKKDAVFWLKLPLAKLGFSEQDELVITDTWTANEESIQVTKSWDYKVVVPKDKSPGGGTRVLIIEKK